MRTGSSRKAHTPLAIAPESRKGTSSPRPSASSSPACQYGVDTTASVDYPDIARKAAAAYLGGRYDFGILCCGTGIGISIAANKVPGIRCALVFDLFMAEMCKCHNDANFLAFGGRITYHTPVIDMIEKFMSSEFEGGRHAVRVNKIEA